MIICKCKKIPLRSHRQKQVKTALNSKIMQKIDSAGQLRGEANKANLSASLSNNNFLYETIPTKRFVGSTFIWYDVSIDIIGNCTGDTNEKVSVWSSSFDINPYEIYSRVMHISCYEKFLTELNFLNLAPVPNNQCLFYYLVNNMRLRLLKYFKKAELSSYILN